jgi:hypothetical protein
LSHLVVEFREIFQARAYPSLFLADLLRRATGDWTLLAMLGGDE